MNQESPDNPFRLGGRYKNRKGFFTVISLAGDEMRIRWDTGEEATSDVASQARILRNMQRDATPAPPRNERSQRFIKPIPPPAPRRTVFSSGLNPDVGIASPTAQQCSRCQRDLVERPIVMIGPKVFCYLCAKLEHSKLYPKLMDEARLAREIEARRTEPARKEYNEALLTFQCAKRQYAAEREAGVNVGFYTERNKWIIAWAITIPCGILLPVLGLLVILPVFLIIQPIWDRERERLLAVFDRTHSAPGFDRTEPAQNSIPDPIVALHPDSSAAMLIGIGYNRNVLLRRDDFTCQSCGSRLPAVALEAHHVLPRAKGGSDSPRNLITLCKQCHFHEDWFGHVHIYNEQRVSEERIKTSRLLSGRFPRRRA